MPYYFDSLVVERETGSAFAKQTVAVILVVAEEKKKYLNCEKM